MSFNKATYDMICECYDNLTYHVGEIYTFHGDLNQYNHGFHFSKNPIDVLRYYSPLNPSFQVLEVDILGDIFSNDSDAGDFVTNQLKVIRIIPLPEYFHLIGW